MMNAVSVQQTIAQAQRPPETPEQTFVRLALLSPVDYDRVREEEAQSLGVRVGTLDREVAKIKAPDNQPIEPARMFPMVEPWPNPVDGAALLTDISETIKKFIICEPETITAATLWIAFTWFIDRVQVAPLAVITAPEKRCGKSQMLDLIGRISRRPLVASNISPAAIFRVIEAHGPTLLIDEADAFLKDNEEARGILNSGHTRSSAYVIRVVGENHEPQQFSTWGAKAISGIGTLADTLMDRAVVLELRRKLPHESVQRLRHADLETFQRLASMLARFSDDAGYAIGQTRPQLPDTLNDRAQDNWEPLLAIADYAGGDWPHRARDAALKISGKEQDALSLSTELLSDIKEVFEVKRVQRISTVDLLMALNSDDLKPWATYNRGKPMSPRQLARRLAEYGIKTQSVRIGMATPKGFMAEWFNDVFDRYLPSQDGPSAQAPQRHKNAVSQAERGIEHVADFSGVAKQAQQRVANIPSVADQAQRCGSEILNATPQPAEISQCCAVADMMGVSSEVEVF